MKRSEQIDQLAAALAAAQGEFEAIPKTAENPFFHSKYADLPSVVLAASPVLSKHGIAVSQLPDFDGTHDLLTTTVMHASGQWIEASMRLHMAKLTAQDQGSAVTYGRRYAYSGGIGIVTEGDDDGEGATRGSRNGHASSAPRSQSRARSVPNEPDDAPPERHPQDRPKGRDGRDQYSWVNGAKPPDPDPKANKLSEGQVKRLFAIAKSKDVDLHDAVHELWGEDQHIDELDWKQGRYIADAMEDDWRPAETREPTEEPF